jgi:hypothetical protein
MTRARTLLPQRAQADPDDSVLTADVDVGHDLAASSTPASKTAGELADAAWDIVDEWGMQSFPASDPPANW